MHPTFNIWNFFTFRQFMIIIDYVTRRGNQNFYLNYSYIHLYDQRFTELLYIAQIHQTKI